MRKNSITPGHITDANQIRDRVSNHVSTGKDINLSGLSFMDQVRADRPKNEDLIRGIKPEEVPEEVLRSLCKRYPSNVVRMALEQGILMVVA